MKKTMILLILLLVPTAFANYDLEEQQFFSYLVNLGLEESFVEITDDEVIVDYVIPEGYSEQDILFQIQGVFIGAAEFAPHTTLSIVQVYYTADQDPLLTATVPTPFIHMYNDDDISIEDLWASVELNSDAVEEISLPSVSERSWTPYIILLLIILAAWYYWKKKK